MSFGGKPSTPSPKLKPKVEVKSETKPKPRLAGSISSSVGDKSQRARDVAVQEAESSPRSPIGTRTPPAPKSPSGPISPSKGLVADNSPSSGKRRTRSSLGGVEDAARGLDFSTPSPKADEKKQPSKADDKKVTRLDDKKQPAKTDTKKQPVKTEERKPFVTGKADSWSPTMKTSPAKPAEKASPVSAEKKPRNASPLSTTPKAKAGAEHINAGVRGFANSPTSKASNLATTNTAAKSLDGPAVVSSSPQSDSGRRSIVVDDDIWICRECGWSYPNAHPSAKHRRNHKKHCAEIKSKKAEGVHVHGGSSDEASSDDEASAVSGTIANVLATLVGGKTSIAEAGDSSEGVAVISGGHIGEDKAIPSSDHATSRQAFTDEGSTEQLVEAVAMNGETDVADGGSLSSEHEIERQGISEEGSDKQHIYELAPGSPSVKARVEELERKCSSLGDSGLISPGIYGSPSKKLSLMRDSPQSSPVKKLLLPEASTLFLDRLHSADQDGTGYHSRPTPSSTASELDVPSSELSEVAPPVKAESQEAVATEQASADDAVISEDREATAVVQASDENVDGTIPKVSQSESGGNKSFHRASLTAPYVEKDIQTSQESVPQNSVGSHIVGHLQGGDEDEAKEDVSVEVSEAATSNISSTGTDGNDGYRSENLKLDSQHQGLNVPGAAEHYAPPVDGGHVSGIRDFVSPDSEVLGSGQGRDELPTDHTELLATPFLHSEAEPDQLKSTEDSSSIDHASGLSVGDVHVPEQFPVAEQFSLPQAHLDAPQFSESESRGLLSIEDPDRNAEDGEQELSPSSDTPAGTEEAAKSDGKGLHEPIADAGASTVAAQGKGNQDVQSVDVQIVGADEETVRDTAVDEKDGAPSEIPAISEMPSRLEDCTPGSLPAESGGSVATKDLDRTSMASSHGRPPATVDVNGTENPAEEQVAKETARTEDEVSAVPTPIAPVTAPNFGGGETSQVSRTSVGTEGVVEKADLLVGGASAEYTGGAVDREAMKSDSGMIDSPMVNAVEAREAGGVAGVQNSALDDKVEIPDLVSQRASDMSNKTEAESSSLYDSTTSELALKEPENLGEAHPASAVESQEVISRRVSFANDAKAADDTGAMHEADAGGLQKGVSDYASPAAEAVQLQEVITDTETPAQYTSGQDSEIPEESSQIVTDGGFPEREDMSHSNISVVQPPPEVPDEVVVESSEPTAHREAAELPKEVEDQHSVIGLAKKVEPALSTASAVAIPRSGRESREKELWERLLDHDVRQNATSPAHCFSSEETWQPEFEEKLLQNTALLNAEETDEKSLYGSQGSRIASAGTHVGGGLEAEGQVDADPDLDSSQLQAGIQAGEVSSKAILRDTEHGAGHDGHEKSVSAQQTQVEFDKGLSHHVQGVLPVVQSDRTEEASQEERSKPTLEASGNQIQSDMSLAKHGSPTVVDANATESSSKSEVSIDNGVKGVEKQHHRLKNLLEEEHQSEQPVTPATEAKASASPRTSPFLKRIIERVRSSPPNVAIPKDVHKEESSKPEVAAGRRSIFRCQCFSPVKSN